MEQVLERAGVKPPSLGASVLLLLPWLLGVVATLLALVGMVKTSPPDFQLQAFPQGGFSVVLPHRARPARIERETPRGKGKLLEDSPIAAGG